LLSSCYAIQSEESYLDPWNYVDVDGI
jgi:hypothetical protein